MGRHRHPRMTRAATERTTLRFPRGFREALRRLVGERMAETGKRLSYGEVLFDLVRDAVKDPK
jgi:hypothetical protein